MILPKPLAKIIVINQKGLVLIVRRSKTAPHHALRWEIPGGIGNSLEDPKETAIRELQEETGIIVYQDNYVFAGMSEDHEYLATFFTSKVDEPSVKLSYEHDQYKWVSPEKALQLIEVEGYRKALRYYKEYILNGHDVVVSAKCLLEYSGNYLLLKRSTKDELGPGLWDLPGGQLDNSETVFQALSRELKEETGITAHGQVMLFAHTEVKPKTLRIRIGLAAKTSDDSVKLSSEHSEYLWVPKGQTYKMAEHPKWPGWGEFVKLFG